MTAWPKIMSAYVNLPPF